MSTLQWGFIMARPRKEIDFNELEKLCNIQCTAEEAAAWFGVSPDTIDRRLKEEYGIGFAEYFKQNRDIGKISLRRKQFQAAMSGNTSMLIWLGKNQLGQSDKQEIQQETVQINIDGDDSEL